MIEGDAQEWLAHADGDLHYARLGQKDAEALESLIVFHTGPVSWIRGPDHGGRSGGIDYDGGAGVGLGEAAGERELRE